MQRDRPPITPDADTVAAPVPMAASPPEADRQSAPVRHTPPSEDAPAESDGNSPQAPEATGLFDEGAGEHGDVTDDVPPSQGDKWPKGGYVPMLCSDDFDWLIKDGNAFCLLALIARRVRRKPHGANPFGLEVGQALTGRGDSKALGISPKAYQTAIKRLVRYGFVGIVRANRGAGKGGIRGTVVTISTRTVFAPIKCGNGALKGALEGALEGARSKQSYCGTAKSRPKQKRTVTPTADESASLPGRLAIADQSEPKSAVENEEAQPHGVAGGDRSMFRW